MSNVNWMSQLGLGERTLGSICLPATHDSGTANLAMPMIPDSSDADIGAVLNELQHIAKVIGDIPGIGHHMPDPLEWFEGHAASAIANISIATSTTVAQQLSDGIRCLDLRVAYVPPATTGDPEFFTWHGLTGTNIDGDDGILDAVSSFLDEATAEIVYITMGHFALFSTYADNYVSTFAGLVKDSLGQWAYQRPIVPVPNMTSQPYQVVFYDPAVQLFNFINLADGSIPVSFQFGNEGDIPLAGDWTGQGYQTIGIYRPSTQTFWVSTSNSNSASDSVSFECTFAQAGDLPFAGDWTGQGKDTIGLYRPTSQTFYLWNESPEDHPQPDIEFQVPLASSQEPLVVLAGDWTGKGYDSVALYDAGWAVYNLWNENANTAASQVPFGPYGGRPLVGDWTSSGVTTLGVFNVQQDPYQISLSYNNITPVSSVALTANAQPWESTWVPLGLSAISGNPLEQTYDSLTENGTRSAVILVNNLSSDPAFWPNCYSPPDNSSVNPVLAGFYTNSDDAQTVMTTQQTQLAEARQLNLPFALYMTVTPTESDSISRVVASLAGPLAELARDLPPPLDVAVLATAATLGIVNSTFPWSTLKELSQSIDGSLGSTISELTSGYSDNPLSFIYLDFYETTDVVDIAINLASK